MNLRHATNRDHFAAALLGATFVLAAHAPAAALAEPVSDADAWQFELTPYILGAGLSGTTGVGSVTADVNKSFSDILQHLDAGLMAQFQASKGLWMFGMDGVYFRIKNQGADSWQGPLGNTISGSLEATVTEQLYQFTAGYRVLDAHTKVDVLGAARYTQLDTDLNLAATTGSPLLPDGSRSISGTENWWDPVIGARVLVPLADEWTLVGYADIGGFGAGSELTYQLLAGVNWQFSRSVAAKAGYRFLYQDYRNGGLVWDMKASGFYLGAGIRF
jgi:opacity protein-like surface antigen